MRRLKLVLKSTLWTVRIIWASDKGEEKGVISVGSVDGNGGSPLAIDCDIHKSHVWDFFRLIFTQEVFTNAYKNIDCSCRHFASTNDIHCCNLSFLKILFLCEIYLQVTEFS